MKYFSDVAAFVLIFTFLVLAVIFTPINDDSGNSIFTGFVTSSVYPGYAVPISSISVDTTLVFNNATDTTSRLFEVSDDIIYRRAYVSYDGQSWTPVNITPVSTVNGEWINGRGLVNVTFSPTRLNLNSARTSSNNTYLIIYSCSKDTNIHYWSCHDGWQIIKFDAKLNSGSSSSTVTWTDELMINGGFENGNFDGWTIVNGVYSRGFKVDYTMSNNVAAKSQAGDYLAYFNGSSSNATGVDFYIYQDVDLNPYADSISAGTAYVNASGWGSTAEYPPNGGDRTRIRIMFLDSSGGIIQTAVDSGVVSKTDSAWWQIAVSNHKIPVGTRYVRMWATSYDPYNSKFDESGSMDSFSVKVGYGGILVNPPTCSNDCSSNGLKQCSGTGYQTCGNYDSDSCLEWSSVTACGGSFTCTGAGNCVAPSPPPTLCTPNAKECYSSTVTRQCNSAGSAWINTDCPTGQICTGAGNCGVFSGTIYYIDANSGSDSAGTGSSVAPWKTLATACSKVKTSGDMIHVNKGVYSESSTCNLAVGVSIEGNSRADSIIRSSVGTSSKTYTIALSSSNSNTNGAQHISNIRLESTTDYTAYAAIGVNNRGNIEIYNVDIINFKEYGIVMHNGESSTAFATGNSIHDCTIINSGAYVGTYNTANGDARGSIDILSQDGIRIYNNVITIDRPDGDNGNTIDGVEGYIKNMKVYNNVLAKKHVPGKTWDFSIEIWSWLGGNEIYNNNITGSIDVVGATKGDSTYSVWVHDNNIGQPTLMNSEDTRGFMLEEYQDGLRGNLNDIILERNHIKNVAAGININTANSGCYITNLRVSYNIFEGIGMSNSDYKGWGVVSSFGGGDIASGGNVNIWNNVFKAADISATQMWGIDLFNVNGPVSIKNNIITGFEYGAVYDSSASATSSLVIQNNIFYNNGNSNTPRGVGSGTISNNYIADPRFVSSSDYHLQYGSPAIDKGVFISGLTKDLEGNSVPYPSGGLTDIGAYEYR